MTAFALSTVFAACTQDTELNETIAKNDFSNIPMVEANFTVNAGVDSRMATKFGWEVGDKVGFAWLGLEGVDATPKVTGDAYQNNPLYCTDASNAAFSAEGMFYIGKYFAYMPYTEGNHTVEPIKFNVAGQTLATNADDLAKHAIYISPEVYELEKEDAEGKVGEGKLPSGIGKNLPLNIARVSNAATINLSFANTEGLTDLKVYGVSLNILNASSAPVLPASFTYAPTASATVTNGAWKGYSASTFYTVAEATEGAIVANNKDGIAVANDALTVYMLTMPAVEALTATHTFEVLVSTNYGNVTVTPGTDDDNTFDFITFTEGSSTPSTDFKASNLFKNFASAGTINVYVDMANIAVTGGDVKTQAELEQQLNTLVVSGYDAAAGVEFNIKPSAANRNKNFVFTDFTLPEGLKTKVILTADETNVAEGFVFSGNTVINKHIVLNVKSTVDGTMTVNRINNTAGAAVTTLEGTGVITVKKGAKLINNGVITNAITTETEDATNKVAAGLYVSNNVAATSGAIANNGEVQWIAGTLPTITGDGVVFANVVDFSTLTNAAAAKVSTARFVETTSFGNSGRNVTIGNNIKRIEIYAPVTMNITKDDIAGVKSTITFEGLTNQSTSLDNSEKAAIEIMENGALTINSDMATTTGASAVDGNEIKFGDGTTAAAVINTAKNTTLALTKIDFINLGAIRHAGSVTSTGVNFTNITVVATGDGEHTSGN